MITLEKFGSFFVGGRLIEVKDLPIKTVMRNNMHIEIDENGEHYIEQAYVQYFVPKTTCQKLPIIFVHGGGHTGVVWENTPDGREGWVHYFLKQEHPIYIMDTVERGRAGWCSLPGIWPEKPEAKSAQRSWEFFRIGSSNNYIQRVAYPGQQFPTESFNVLIKYNVPRWNCNLHNTTLALIELVKKIGDCIIISHSNSSQAIISCIHEIPGPIKQAVLIEPASLPEKHKELFLNGSRFLFVYGDFINESQFWVGIYNKFHNFYDVLKQNHVGADWVSLPERGLQGNSHQIMMDKNNMEVASLVSNWMNQY